MIVVPKLVRISILKCYEIDRIMKYYSIDNNNDNDNKNNKKRGGGDFTIHRFGDIRQRGGIRAGNPA